MASERSEAIWAELFKQLPPRDWEGECAGMDIEIFYGGSVTEALSVCRRCAHRVDCLQRAIDLDDTNGVQGIPAADREYFSGKTARQMIRLSDAKRQKAPRTGSLS